MADSTRPGGFTHFGESADQYVLDLWREGHHDASNYADAYLRYLREAGKPGEPSPPQRGTRGLHITAAEAERIQKRLRNTGTSEDFARRGIGGTYGTFRKKKGWGRTADRAARRAGKR